MGISDRLLLRKAKDKVHMFEFVEFTYEEIRDEIGTKESKRIDTVIFEGSILECQAYIQLLKDGWFAKQKYV